MANTTSSASALTPAFAAAIVKMQGEIEGAKKGRENTFFKQNGKNTKYADLTSCWEACRDALQANQIGVVQLVTDAPQGYVGLETNLVYGPTGEVYGSRFSMPLKDASNAQAAGSALTYARRYALCAIIGICPEDDDGNSAASTKPSTRPVEKPAATITDTEGYWKKFQDEALKGGTDSAKTYYSSVKQLPIQEPQKTELLSRMATVIKGMK